MSWFRIFGKTQSFRRALDKSAETLWKTVCFYKILGEISVFYAVIISLCVIVCGYYCLYIEVVQIDFFMLQHSGQKLILVNYFNCIYRRKVSILYLQWFLGWCRSFCDY